MKKLLLIPIISLLFLNCQTDNPFTSNDNRITIKNLAQYGIFFNFRAKEYQLQHNESIVIDKIPNGTYSYATTYSVPSIATSYSADDAAGGALTFQYRETGYLFIYSSVLTTDGKYSLGVTITSSESSDTQNPSDTAK